MRLANLIIFIIALLSISNASAAVINIPSDYATIQEGIDAAAIGDTVLVAPGTYEENINFNGKAITVKSGYGAKLTFINGGSPSNPDFGSVVTFNNNEEADSVLDGFSIFNGTGTFDLVYKYSGGGIYCEVSSPTIVNNRIIGNSADLGGGIYCFHSDSIIKNNTISWNAAQWDGGGIDCEYSSPTIVNNTISENSAGYGGGGIFSWDQTSSPVITKNLIFGNAAGMDGGGIECNHNQNGVTIKNNIITDNSAVNGGGINCNDSSPTIAGNLIFANTVTGSGGGICCWWTVNSLIENNTIAKNSADLGGGICCDDFTDQVITNTILWDNRGQTGTEMWIGDASFPSTVTISYSNVRGGQGLVHTEPNCTLNWGLGMIDLDPLFVDSDNNDFHLTYPSPCRDTGDNGSVTTSYDYEGDPRMAWGGTVDMGSDEFYTHLYVSGDATPGGSIQGNFVGLPSTSPVCLFIGSGVRQTPAHTVYGDFYLLPPKMLIPLVPIPSDGVLSIPATVPLTPPGPYEVPTQALIGLSADSLTNLCMLEVRN